MCTLGLPPLIEYSYDRSAIQKSLRFGMLPLLGLRLVKLKRGLAYLSHKVSHIRAILTVYSNNLS